MNIATSADGTGIHWTASGSGIPVLLVHGITENHTFWDPVVPHLVDRCRVIRLDLRGHGESDRAAEYTLAHLAADAAAVTEAAGLEQPRLVGHSLGGIVVTTLGATLPAHSIVNVDQSLQLDALKEVLTTVEPQLRDPGAFPAVMQAVFDQLAGPMLSDDHRSRMDAARRPEADVVLGIWDLMLTSPAAEVAATVDELLSGYSAQSVPYLSLHGLDPGPDYAIWLGERIGDSAVEYWEDHGHYPHVVDPPRFVARLEEFWTQEG